MTAADWRLWMAGKLRPVPRARPYDGPPRPRPCRLGEPLPVEPRDWSHKPVIRSANTVDRRFLPSEPD